MQKSTEKSKFINFYSILCQVIKSYIGKTRKIRFCFVLVTYRKIQYVRRINKSCIGWSNIGPDIGLLYIGSGVPYIGCVATYWKRLYTGITHIGKCDILAFQYTTSCCILESGYILLRHILACDVTGMILEKLDHIECNISYIGSKMVWYWVK